MAPHFEGAAPTSSKADHCEAHATASKTASKKKKKKVKQKICIQTSTSGPCQNEAVHGQTRCTVHICPHPGCTAPKSSTAAFCGKHAAAAAAAVAEAEMAATPKKKKDKKKEAPVVKSQPKALHEERYPSKETVRGFCGAITVGKDVPQWQPTPTSNRQHHASVREESFTFQALIDYLKKDFKKKDIKPGSGMELEELKDLVSNDPQAIAAWKINSSIGKGDPNEKCNYKKHGKSVCTIGQSLSRGCFCSAHSCLCGMQKSSSEKECSTCSKLANRTVLLSAIDGIVPDDENGGKLTLRVFKAAIQDVLSGGSVAHGMPAGTADEKKTVKFESRNQRKTRIAELSAAKKKILLPPVKAVDDILGNSKVESKKPKTSLASVEWLIDALELSPHDAETKKVVTRLFSDVHFCGELGSRKTKEIHNHNADCERECPGKRNPQEACTIHNKSNELCRSSCGKEVKTHFDHLKDVRRDSD